MIHHSAQFPVPLRGSGFATVPALSDHCIRDQAAHIHPHRPRISTPDSLYHAQRPETRYKRRGTPKVSNVTDLGPLHPDVSSSRAYTLNHYALLTNRQYRKALRVPRRPQPNLEIFSILYTMTISMCYTSMPLNSVILLRGTNP
jgi:hypothetical protein